MQATVQGATGLLGLQQDPAYSDIISPPWQTRDFYVSKAFNGITHLIRALHLSLLVP